MANLAWRIGEGHFRSKGRGWQNSLQRAWLAEFVLKGVAGRVRSKGRGWQKILHILLKILTTFAVIAAEPDRLFPELNNTPSAMTGERLESLLLIQVHRDRTLSIEKTIESFASLKASRFTLTL